MEEEDPLAKKTKLNEDKDKMTNQTEIDERYRKFFSKFCIISFLKLFSKIVFLAIEVWVDVLGFIRRIQLAHTISLTNRRFY
jgi:hypothetical protein